MQLSSVVLPEPDRPRSATNSPRATRQIDAAQRLHLARAEMIGARHTFDADERIGVRRD